MNSNGHQWPRAAFFLGRWVPNEGEPGDTGLYWQDAHGRVYDNFNNVDDSNIYYPHDGYFEGVTELHLHGQYLHLKDKLDRRTEEVRALQNAGQRRNQKIKQLKAELTRSTEYRHRAYKRGYERGYREGVEETKDKQFQYFIRATKRRAPWPRARAQVYKVRGKDMWSAGVHYRARGCAWKECPTREEALNWAARLMRNLHERNYPY